MLLIAAKTAIECRRTTLVELQAEIDRWMSNVLETSTELNSAKGTITKLEGQIQEMQQAHFTIWSNPDEASYSSGVGVNLQTEKSAQYLDKAFLLVPGAGGTDMPQVHLSLEVTRAWWYIFWNSWTPGCSLHTSAKSFELFYFQMVDDHPGLKKRKLQSWSSKRGLPAAIFVYGE